MELLTEHLVTYWTSLKINKVKHGFHSVKPGNLLEIRATVYGVTHSSSSRSKWMKLISLSNSV